MTHKVQPLAEPFSLPCGQVLANRLVKSAMSETLGTLDNRVTPSLVSLYRTWGQSGCALLVTGNVMVDRNAISEPGNVCIEDERDMALLKEWAQAGQHAGNKIWVQLNHPGRQSPKGLNKENIAPSAVPFSKALSAYFNAPRAATETEILDIIERFAKAAAIVKAAGFDGVQIHAAHGYLASQFLSPLTNQRQDQWGGSSENRRRFVLALYRAIRSAVGTDFAVGIKLNSADFQKGGFSEEESSALIAALEAEGIDMVEISGGTYEAPAMSGIKQKESTRAREAYFLQFAERIRHSAKTPLLVTGGFRTLTGMNAALSGGSLDLVGLARGLAVEPDLGRRLLAGSDPLYPVKPITTGIKMLDRTALMEIVWYARQLRRIAHGRDPKPNESGLWSFVANITRSSLGTWRTRRLRA